MRKSEKNLPLVSAAYNQLKYDWEKNMDNFSVSSTIIFISEKQLSITGIQLAYERSVIRPFAIAMEMNIAWAQLLLSFEVMVSQLNTGSQSQLRVLILGNMLTVCSSGPVFWSIRVSLMQTWKIYRHLLRIAVGSKFIFVRISPVNLAI